MSGLGELPLTRRPSVRWHQWGWWIQVPPGCQLLRTLATDFAGGFNVAKIGFVVLAVFIRVKRGGYRHHEGIGGLWAEWLRVSTLR